MSPVVSTTAVAAVLYGPEDLRIERRDVRPPQEGEAQVEVVCTGLCGSDCHYYTHGRNGDFRLKAPLVLGHESSGIVTALGAGVTHLRVGQRVAIEAGIYCKACKMCKEGRYNLCENMRFCSSAKTFPHADGTLQSRMNHPAELLHPLPESVTFEQAALAEPLCVVMHATRRAQLRPGHSVLVMGAGAVGLLTCAVAKATGAYEVVAVDIDPARLEFAERQGFVTSTHTTAKLPPPSSPSEALARAEDAATKLKMSTGNLDGFDVVFECTGAEPCIQTAVHCAATAGKLVLVGMGTPRTYLPIAAAAFREVDIIGVFRYHHTYPPALNMLASGSLKGIEKMVTQRFPLEQAKKAFEMIRKGTDEKGNMVIKAMICSDRDC